MAPKRLVQGSKAHRTYQVVAWGLFALFVLLVAFAYVDTGSVEVFSEENKYSLSVLRLNKAIAFMIAILGLQVVVGYTGQIALGQSFFFGLGAYACAYLVEDHNWPYFATLIVAVPLCFVVGMLLGLPALRIQGLYLALVTLGLAAIFPAIVKLDSLLDITAGTAGKQVGSDLDAPSWLPLDAIAEALQKIPVAGPWFGDGGLSSREESQMWRFLLFTLVLGVCLWLVANLVKSRPGRALRAIRDNETGAAVSGVDLAMTKTLSFGIASALGGVGGVVYVAQLGIASPDDFTQLLSILFIVGLVVGGVGTLEGAVVGGLVIAFIPDWASETGVVGPVPERWLQGPTGSLILGIGLIAITFLLPGGIVAGARSFKSRFIQVVPRPPRIAPAGADGGAVAADDHETLASSSTE